MELVIINAETSDQCRKIIQTAYERVLPMVKLQGKKKQRNFIQSVIAPGRQIPSDMNSNSVAMKVLDEQPKDELQVAVVIDGLTLEHALADDLVDEFLQLCSLCCSVVSYLS